MSTTTHDIIMILVSVAILFYSKFYILKIESETTKVWGKRLTVISVAMLIGYVIDFILNFFNVW